jgi:hypothetical protein
MFLGPRPRHTPLNADRHLILLVPGRHYALGAIHHTGGARVDAETELYLTFMVLHSSVLVLVPTKTDCGLLPERGFTFAPTNGTRSWLALGSARKFQAVGHVPKSVHPLNGI